jgi:hypothetical protein
MRWEDMQKQVNEMKENKQLNEFNEDAEKTKWSQREYKQQNVLKENMNKQLNK